METADGPVRFRIIAGAAHSWSTLLLESEPGALFVYSLPTAELELIHQEAADRLIATRAYRPWRGASDWTSLASLPVAGIAERPALAPNPTTVDGDSAPHAE